MLSLYTLANAVCFWQGTWLTQCAFGRDLQVITNKARTAHKLDFDDVLYSRQVNRSPSRFRGVQQTLVGVQWTLVGSDVFVHYLTIFVVVTVHRVSTVTVARGDRCVLERNIKGAVDGFQDALIHVAGDADIRRSVTTHLLDTVVRLITDKRTAVNADILIHN